MKSITKLILAITVLALATIACGSTPTPVTEIQERVVVVTATSRPEPTARPTARPTAVPSCFGKSDLLSTIQEFYGVNASFAYDPEVSNWDQTATIYEDGVIANISYNISGNCITALGASVSFENDGYRAGEWLALPAVLMIDDARFFNAFESFISDGFDACLYEDQLIDTVISGATARFGCWDFTTFMTVGTAVFPK